MVESRGQDGQEIRTGGSEPGLRSAVEADIPAIIAISHSAYWSNFDRVEPGSAGHPGYRELVAEMHEREARDFWSEFTIAEISGEAVGWGARFAGKNEIAEMWVHADFQRRGAGAALIRKFLKDVADERHNDAWIETHRRNEAAISLYRRMGFVPDHTAMRWSQGLGRDIPLIRMRYPLD